MSSAKDSSSSRSLNQHRLSVSSNQSATIPLRQSHSRHHSHSVSLGATNNGNRIARRKSMNSSAANNAAAVVAALRESGEATSHRRSLPNRKASETASSNGTFGTDDNAASRRKVSPFRTTDGHGEKPTTKHRSRRASEGSHLIKGEGKRVSEEVRCDTCGKGYKHSSCLTKHMWEHDPAWAVTSKFLISKHQQVQLLEAASVLVTMNHDVPTPPQTPRMVESEGSSASPAASGTSDLHDGLSSAETTPPPMGDDHSFLQSPRFRDPKRQSRSSSVFSRSYQSAPSSSFLAGSAPSPGFSHFGHQSGDSRPPTSGTGMVPMSDEDEAGLAAAVELCHFGTPRSGPVHLPPNVPPVPPLPSRFLSPTRTNSDQSSGNTVGPSPYNPLGMHPPMTQPLSDERDVKMEHYHADDDDDGVFGKMEE